MDHSTVVHILVLVDCDCWYNRSVRLLDAFIHFRSSLKLTSVAVLVVLVVEGRCCKRLGIGLIARALWSFDL